jgi:hypothetical protein
MTDQRTAEKQLLLQVRPKVGGPWCVMEVCELLDMLDGDTENVYEMKLVRMTDKQWERLPEFEGW